MLVLDFMMSLCVIMKYVICIKTEVVQRSWSMYITQNISFHDTPFLDMYERHTKLKFVGFVEQTSLYHCSNFQLCVTLLQVFTQHRV